MSLHETHFNFVFQAKRLRRSDVRSLHPEGRHGTQCAFRMNLSPLECAVAAKHHVLPVFSRNRPRPSPLESALLSLLASVDSKWLTARLTRLESALTKNNGVGEVAAFSVTFRRSDVQTFRAPPLVPLQRNRFGATISKAAKFLYDLGKQVRFPRCLSL